MKTKYFIVLFMTLFLWAGPVLAAGLLSQNTAPTQYTQAIDIKRAAVAAFELDVLPAQATFEKGNPIVIEVGLKNPTDIIVGSLRSSPYNTNKNLIRVRSVQVEFSLWDKDMCRYVIAGHKVDVDSDWASPRSRVSLACVDLDAVACGLPRGNYLLTVRLTYRGTCMDEELKVLFGKVYTKGIKII